MYIWEIMSVHLIGVVVNQELFSLVASLSKSMVQLRWCNTYIQFIHIQSSISHYLVRAASGLIGGDLSHEFHVTADIGEDTVVTCPK